MCCTQFPKEVAGASNQVDCYKITLYMIGALACLLVCILFGGVCSMIGALCIAFFEQFIQLIGDWVERII